MNKLFILFIAVSLFACNSAQKPEAEKTTLNIELNEGEKWNVNDEMKPHILGAETILDLYISNENSDYLGLESELRALNQNLIKSCSMKGESHDELHKWLLPHMNILKALKDSKSEANAMQQIANLQNSFDLYHQYFK